MSKYTTVQGDSFDAIAHRVLGDVKHTAALMRCNTAYLEYVTFPSGVVLELPQVEEQKITSVKAPWKKVAG